MIIIRDLNSFFLYFVSVIYLMWTEASKHKNFLILTTPSCFILLSKYSKIKKKSYLLSK